MSDEETNEGWTGMGGDAPAGDPVSESPAPVRESWRQRKKRKDAGISRGGTTRIGRPPREPIAPMTPEEIEKATAFDRAIVDTLLDATSRLLVTFVHKQGYTEVSDQMALSADEKTAIGQSAIPVLHKWMPSGFGGRFQEEIILGLTAFGVVSAKYAILRAETDRLRAVQSGNVATVN